MLVYIGKITHNKYAKYDKEIQGCHKEPPYFYQIDNKSTLSEKELLDLIRFAVEYVPSAFNSQTTRVVLLTGEAHQKLWNIVKILCVSGFLRKLLLKRNRK